MNWSKLLKKKSLTPSRVDLVVREDVPSGVFGYYFRVTKDKKKWSVVNFLWLKDEQHKEFYTEGCFTGWEAMDDQNNIIRADCLVNLIASIPPTAD